VRGARQQVDTERLGVDGQPSDRLTGIGVEPHPGLAGEPRGFGHLLHRAQLVVRMLHAREQGARRSHLGGVAVEVDAPVLVDRDLDDLEPIALQRMADPAHGGVFDRAHHDARAELTHGPDAAPDGERDRFRPSRGEDDLVRLGAKRACHRLPGLVEHRAGGAPGGVDQQRIAEGVEGAHQRRTRLGQQRSG
jgi:hypothetical protein